MGSFDARDQGREGHSTPGQLESSSLDRMQEIIQWSVHPKGRDSSCQLA